MTRRKTDAAPARPRKPPATAATRSALAATESVRRWAGNPVLEPFLRPLVELLKDPANTRRHPEVNIQGLMASFARYGQQVPIVSDSSGVIRKGNGSLEAVRRLGWTHLAVIPSDLAGSDLVGYAIADNATGLSSEWDDAILAAQLAALQEEGFPLEATGFGSEELATLLAGAESADAGDGTAGTEEDGGGQVDRAAELQAQWGTERGQLWTIPSKATPGRSHRLLIGDSSKAEDVTRLMGGERAVLMNTDPPYGIDYSKLKDGIPRRGFANHQEKWGDIENDTLTDGAGLQSFLEKMIRAAVPHLSETAAYYFWHPMLTQGTFFAAAAAAAADILIHRQIIWVKPGFVLTRSGMYHWQHELCFYGWRRGKTPPWYGDKSQTSVWDLRRDADHGQHPTQKPVELFGRPIANHTRPGESVYEPFAGSGSQYVAAEQTGRLCYGLEIAPKYAAVILQRLADLGLAPTLEG